MKITEVRLTKRNEDDNLLAYGSITFDDDFVVNGIKVMRSKKGELFVSYPSKQNRNGEYKDICYPMTKALREDISESVLSKYENMDNE